VENFKYLGVTLNEDNKTYFILRKFFKNKNLPKELKLRLKNTIIDKTLTYPLGGGGGDLSPPPNSYCIVILMVL
jgi:hypothetical protein